MLNNCLENLECFSKKHRFTYKTYQFKKDQLWGNDDEEEHNRWALFEKQPGLYILSTMKKVIYIGVSSSGSNIGGRLFEHFTNAEKLQYLRDDSDIIILTFREDEKYLSLAAESYLIEKIHPILNKTKG